MAKSKKATGQSIADLARTLYAKDGYLLGATMDLSKPPPPGQKFDCSLFATYVVYAATGVLFGAGSSDPRAADPYSGRWYTEGLGLPSELQITQDEAKRTPGAIAIRKPRTDKFGHVAIMLGGGRTAEALGSDYGVLEFHVDGREWDLFIRIPGVSYTVQPAAPPTTPAPGRVLRLGVRGPDVQDLERRLAAAGFATVRDTFDTALELAVRSYQRANGLTVDGIAGKDTRGKLGM